MKGGEAAEEPVARRAMSGIFASAKASYCSAEASAWYSCFVNERRQHGVTREELLDRYAAGERDFAGTQLAGINLQNQDLRDIDLREANLRGGNLRNAKFRDSDLRNIDFRDADLRVTSFRGSNLEGARFEGSIRRYATIDAETYSISNWTPDTLLEWRRAGATIRQFDELPDDAQKAVLGTREWLTMYFDTALNPVERWRIELALEALRIDAPCELVEFRKTSDRTTILLSSERIEYLEKVAQALHECAWEREPYVFAIVVANGETPTDSEASLIVRQIADFAKLIGLDLVHDAPAVRGSWLKRFWFRSREALSQGEATRRHEATEENLRTCDIERQRTESIIKHAECIERVMNAVGKDGTASKVAFLMDTLLVMKYPDQDGKPVLVCTQIARAERDAIVSNPDLMVSPERLLERLAAIVLRPATSSCNHVVSGQVVNVHVNMGDVYDTKISGSAVGACAIGPHASSAGDATPAHDASDEQVSGRST